MSVKKDGDDAAKNGNDSQPREHLNANCAATHTQRKTLSAIADNNMSVYEECLKLHPPPPLLVVVHTHVDKG